MDGCELDHKEDWVLNYWCSWTVVLEKTLESPLDWEEKGNKSWIFIGRTVTEAKDPVLWPPDVKSCLIWKGPDVGEDWRQEEKGATEDEMAGWHHQLLELAQTHGSSSQWCHPTISSSAVPFSSCLQSSPASGSFLMSPFFTSHGQSIRASASASVLPMIIQNWFPLGWTGWISLQSNGLSRVNTIVQKHQFFGTQPSLWTNSHIHTWLLEKP